MTESDTQSWPKVLLLGAVLVTLALSLRQGFPTLGIVFTFLGVGAVTLMDRPSFSRRRGLPLATASAVLAGGIYVGCWTPHVEERRQQASERRLDVAEWTSVKRKADQLGADYRWIFQRNNASADQRLPVPARFLFVGTVERVDTMPGGFRFEVSDSNFRLVTTCGAGQITGPIPDEMFVAVAVVGERPQIGAPQFSDSPILEASCSWASWVRDGVLELISEP